MSILSNFDIEDICNHFRIPLVSVCSKDQLPKRFKSGAFVINMANHDKPGTHWVCLISDKSGCLYLDSFGCPPPKEIEKYCKNKPLYTNKVQIQADTSVSCGWYCIEFLNFAKGDHFNGIKSFTDLFVHKHYLLENDKILRKLIE